MTRSMERLLDSELHRKILVKLKIDPVVDAGKIGVAVENGIVTLAGTVRSFSEKRTAEKAVKLVRGVRGLASDLNVEAVKMETATSTTPKWPPSFIVR
jgi:osmotically-inducible protein OsmY